jgi:tripartite motif-containing protein 71
MKRRTAAVMATVGLALALAAPAQAASGKWNRAWGNDVNGGGIGVFGICTVAANCMVGETNDVGPAGNMFDPAGVAIDSGGNVYVADSGNNRIQKFDALGNFQRTWGEGVDMTTGGNLCTLVSGDTCQSGGFGAASGEMSQPSGVAVDSGGNVYVVDHGNNRVEKFSSSGIFERTWGKGVNATTPGNLCTFTSGDTCQAGSTGGLGGEMKQPIGIAIDSGDNVYVADTENDRIQKFDSSGTFERTWGKSVNATTPGNLCTAASGNTCQAGSHTTALGGEMSNPAGVATDSSGNVYVADAFNNRIQRFDSAGSFQRAWGQGVNGGTAFGVCTVAASCHIGLTGGLGGEMLFPFTVDTDAGDHVYVGDAANNRIQKFASSGTWNRAWGAGVNGGTAFGICTVVASCQAGGVGGLGGAMDTPQGVATDSRGDLYVADTNNDRIQKFADPVVTSPPPPSGTGNPLPTATPSATPAAKKCKKKAKKRAAAAKKCKKRKKK